MTFCGEFTRRERAPVPFLFLITVLLFTSTLDAYVLPDYKITDEEYGTPAETVLAQYMSRLDTLLTQGIRSGQLDEYLRNNKLRLKTNERHALKQYKKLKTAIRFWEYVVDLKKSLIALQSPLKTLMPAARGKKQPPEQALHRTVQGQASSAKGLLFPPGGGNNNRFLEVPPRKQNQVGTPIEEADAIAKLVLATTYGLSREYGIRTSAWFHNFLVNSGVKEKGHCYHYVNDFLKALSKRDWQHFDLHWGEAYADTFRENNALIITAKGQPFQEGLAIDSWRTAGRPFWAKVRKDRFPWVEWTEDRGMSSIDLPSARDRP